MLELIVLIEETNILKKILFSVYLIIVTWRNRFMSTLLGKIEAKVKQMNFIGHWTIQPCLRIIWAL